MNTRRQIDAIQISTHLTERWAGRCSQRTRWARSFQACRRCCPPPASSPAVATHSVQWKDGKMLGGVMLETITRQSIKKQFSIIQKMKRELISVLGENSKHSRTSCKTKRKFVIFVRHRLEGKWILCFMLISGGLWEEGWKYFCADCKCSARYFRETTFSH